MEFDGTVAVDSDWYSIRAGSPACSAMAALQLDPAIDPIRIKELSAAPEVC